MAKAKTVKKSKGSGSQKNAELEKRAYYRWLDRGGGHGGDVEDWLDAEEETAQNVFDHDPEN